MTWKKSLITLWNTSLRKSDLIGYSYEYKYGNYSALLQNWRNFFLVATLRNYFFARFDRWSRKKSRKLLFCITRYRRNNCKSQTLTGCFRRRGPKPCSTRTTAIESTRTNELIKAVYWHDGRRTENLSWQVKAAIFSLKTNCEQLFSVKRCWIFTWIFAWKRRLSQRQILRINYFTTP